MLINGKALKRRIFGVTICFETCKTFFKTRQKNAKLANKTLNAQKRFKNSKLLTKTFFLFLKIADLF